MTEHDGSAAADGPEAATNGEPATNEPATNDPARRPPPPPMPDPSFKPKDYVDGPSSPALHNVVLEYEYSSGSSYRLSFDDNFGVVFQMLSDGSEPRGPIPYLARELRENQYLVHWHVREFGIHVALVVDLSEKTLSVAALMPPGSWEFFDQAVNIRISRPA